jgi:hypothetical protein
MMSGETESPKAQLTNNEELSFSQKIMKKYESSNLRKFIEGKDITSQASDSTVNTFILVCYYISHTHYDI